MVLLSTDLRLTGPPDNMCLLTEPHVWLGSEGSGAWEDVGMCHPAAGLHGAPSPGRVPWPLPEERLQGWDSQSPFSRVISTALETSQC